MSYSGNFNRVFPPPYGQQFVNYQGLLINVVGTTGPFLMPQNQPLNTLNLLTVTSMAGVPTSTPPGGSFAYNSATNVVYVYIAGTGWVPITGAGAVETWAQTLLAGNTSGATNPTIDAGQNITFTGAITIASPTANSNVIIGPSAASTALANGLAVGANANSSATGASAFGANAIASGTNSFALGASSTASGTDSLALGNGATTAGFASSVALGPGATSTAALQIMLGTSAFANANLGSLSFSTGLAVGNTTNLLTLPKIAGTPSGAATSGSLAYDSTNNLFYGRTNAAWVQIATGVAATPTWNAVLTAGNTSGAVNPIISSGQAEVFVSGVCIGSANVAPATATPLATTILIGGGATASGGQTTVVGRLASASTFANDVVIGYNASATGATCTVVGHTATGTVSSVVLGQAASSTTGNSVAIGVSATTNSDQSVCVGQSTGVTGAGGVAVGYAATCASNCVVMGLQATTNNSTGAIAIGANVTFGAGANNSIVFGSSTTVAASCTGCVVIGVSANANTSDAIAIGRSTQGNGVASVAVGQGITNNLSNDNCVFLGPSITNSQAGDTGNVAVGSAITFTSGSVSTNNVVLGRSITVPAGSAKTIWFATGLTTVAASVAVNYNTATGQMYPVTSARKFKQNIHDLEAPERILNAVPRKYNMAKGHCHCPPMDGCDGTCCEEVGVIADEMEAAGLSDFVVYGDHERKEAVGVLYDRMVVPLIAVVRSQQERLQLLEEQLARLLSSKL